VTQKGNSRPHVHTTTRHDQQKRRYRHVLLICNPSKASLCHTSMHPTHSDALPRKAPTVLYSILYIYGKYCMYIRICIGHLLNLSYTVNIQYILWVYGSKGILGQCDDATQMQLNFYASRKSVLSLLVLLPPEIE